MQRRGLNTFRAEDYSGCATSLRIFVFAAAVVFASNLQATAIQFGQWYEFSFPDAKAAGMPVMALGCAPADPAGFMCVPSSGNNSQFVGAPPWTFTAPNGGATFTVTDAFTYGESFYILDNGAIIFGTPNKKMMGAATCGSNPDNCVVDPNSSHAMIPLNKGMHSIQIEQKEVMETDGEGSGYFRVDQGVVQTTPEPAPAAELALGLLSLAAIRQTLHRI